MNIDNRETDDSPDNIPDKILDNIPNIIPNNIPDSTAENTPDNIPAVNKDLYQQVIEDFKETGSVEKTAKNCRLARVTAQKILITEDLWSSQTSRKVAECLQQGMTVKEIAQKLFITEKTVQTYTPYTRGMYGVTTEDARYSQDYRDRMQTAAANMHQKESDNQTKEKE